MKENTLLFRRTAKNINSERNFLNLVKILNDVAAKYDYPVIVSTHPRTRKMVEQKGISFHQNVQR